MKSYHAQKGWLIKVTHPEREATWWRLPYEPHDGPADAIAMFPPVIFTCPPVRERWRLRAATKKDGTPKTTTYKGETFAVVEYAYEED